MPAKGQTKYTIQDIRDSMIAEGYVLLTDHYKNNAQKIEYICPQGHRRATIWSNWLKGARCKLCRCKQRGQNDRKYNIGIVRDLFAKENYVLISEEYKGYKSKLSYECPKGHKGSVTFCNWLKRSVELQCPLTFCGLYASRNHPGIYESPGSLNIKADGTGT